MTALEQTLLRQNAQLSAINLELLRMNNMLEAKVVQLLSVTEDMLQNLHPILVLAGPAVTGRN